MLAAYPASESARPVRRWGFFAAIAPNACGQVAREIWKSADRITLMMFVLLFVFVIGPLIELYALVTVAGWIGWLPALALLGAMSLFGAWLVKREGLGVMRRMQETTGRGEVPANQVVDGGLLLLAGCLCIVPGFVTGTVGLLLLVPPIRVVVRNRLVPRWTGAMRVPGFSRFTRASVVDVEYIGDVTPKRTEPSAPIELGPAND
ncbi:FxsA Protein affecting phage T7 exclusion by the F plasmid [Acidimicrobiia bacterium]